MPDGTVVMTEAAPTEPLPVVAEMEQAYHDALHAMAQPLLHAVAPAALKAVRQVEQLSPG
jgi:hypothetical protein